MNGKMAFDRDFISEMRFSASRSSGPGGQNVNKVNSRIELRFDIKHSALLSDEEKVLLMQKLASRINSEGELILTSQESRSQLKNRESVIANFYRLIKKAFEKSKKRVDTRPTLASIEKRLDKKRKLALKKAQRSRPLE